MILQIREKFNNILNKVYTQLIRHSFFRFGRCSQIGRMSQILGAKYISIGNNSSIGERAVLTAWDNYRSEKYTPEIVIGNNVSIGQDCHITSINKIIIKDNVLIGKKVTISDNSHGSNSFDEIIIPPINRRLTSKGEVLIDENVWIGDKATILSNVSIGYGSIVAANAVVTKDVPAYCIVAGTPAKIIKIIKNNINDGE